MRQAEEILRFRGLMRGLVGAAAAGPLALFAGDLLPTWATLPPVAVLMLALLSSAIGLAIALKVQSRSNRRAKFTKAIAFGCMCLVAYIIMFSMFVVTVSQIQDGKVELINVIVGWELLPGIGESSARELLYSGGPPDAIWTRPSLLIVRISLLGLFLTSLAFLCFGLMALSRVDRPDQPLTKKL